jgi:hypothetical protein
MYSEELRKILSGKIGEMEITQEFLLTFALIMEIPMLMIILSRVVKRKINRILNVVFGLLLIIVQAGSLTADDNSLHYIFFSIVEISTLIAIVWLAIGWKDTSQEPR